MGILGSKIPILPPNCPFLPSQTPKSPVFAPKKAFPVLVGSMDGSGSLSAQLLHLLSPNLRAKLACQVQKGPFSTQNSLGGGGGGRDFGLNSGDFGAFWAVLSNDGMQKCEFLGSFESFWGEFCQSWVFLWVFQVPIGFFGPFMPMSQK